MQYNKYYVQPPAFRSTFNPTASPFSHHPSRGVTQCCIIDHVGCHHQISRDKETLRASLLRTKLSVLHLKSLAAAAACWQRGFSFARDCKQLRYLEGGNFQHDADTCVILGCAAKTQFSPSTSWKISPMTNDTGFLWGKFVVVASSFLARKIHPLETVNKFGSWSFSSVTLTIRKIISMMLPHSIASERHYGISGSIRHRRGQYLQKWIKPFRSVIIRNSRLT